MINQQIIVSDTWQLISDNIDYTLQVTSGSIYIKAASETPSTIVGSFELSNGQVISNQVLHGKVYIRTADNLLAYVSLAV